VHHLYNVGSSGHGSDGGVFANSQFDAAMHNNQLHMPTFERLPGVTYSLPYVLVANELDETLCRQKSAIPRVSVQLSARSNLLEAKFRDW